MQLPSSLDGIAGLAPEELAKFRLNLDPEWIEAALQAIGTATIRKRRLPAEQVVWLVIGMALFRNKAITEVASSLDIALPTPSSGPTAARSAVSNPRGRLGEAPLAWLFDRCSNKCAHAAAAHKRWRGLALYAVDGTTMWVPDTDENREHFGLASGNRGSSAYPLGRLVALTAVRSHVLARVEFGPYRSGEYTYAAKL